MSTLVQQPRDRQHLSSSIPSQGSQPSQPSPEPVGQFSVLQERKRVRRPSQYLPPFRGTGLVQSREENWTPPPQLLEQSPHGPQGPQPPACGICRGTEWKWDKHTLLGLEPVSSPQAFHPSRALGSHIEVLELVHVKTAAAHAGL